MYKLPPEVRRARLFGRALLFVALTESEVEIRVLRGESVQAAIAVAITVFEHALND